MKNACLLSNCCLTINKLFPKSNLESDYKIEGKRS